jgi:hypothetical protein
MASPSTTLITEIPYSLSGDEERLEFKRLQESFGRQFQQSFPDKMAAKTVVIIPSLSLDTEILKTVEGVNFYEERLLCLLMLLRMPRTQVIYVTSMPIDPVIIDYYLHLLPGITTYHARQRLTLLSCFDASGLPLTDKLLSRPRMLQRIKEHIADKEQTHMACFNVTASERKLAVALGIPIFGCDPDLQDLGNKSNGRKLFRSAGIPLPPGYEDLHSREEVVDALVKLKEQVPEIRKAVVKLNEGFSGDGNAVFSYADLSHDADFLASVDAQLTGRLEVVAGDLTPEHFLEKMVAMGGVVEAFVDGDVKTSPSVQCRVTPLGEVEILSTHDQMLGGSSGQVYLGAKFPADKAYAAAIGSMGKKIGERLCASGVLGRFAIDFISVKKGEDWLHYAIEINLRKGGTTHPYLMLEFLTNGVYREEIGQYYTASGQPRHYVCSDNVKSEAYKGLTPHDLIDIAMCDDLLYDSASQEGVVFHLISALSQFGKLGVLCIGSTPERAEAYYRKTVEALDREVRADRGV